MYYNTFSIDTIATGVSQKLLSNLMLFLFNSEWSTVTCYTKQIATCTICDIFYRGFIGLLKTVFVSIGQKKYWKNSKINGHSVIKPFFHSSAMKF